MPRLLCFNLPQAALMRLGLYAASRGIALSSVPPEAQECTLAQLLQGEVFPGKGRFAEPMLVMADFADGELDSLLRYMRASGIGIPQKAVATETNRAWPAWVLARALQQEHAAMQKRQAEAKK